MELKEKIAIIQKELKAPKNQYNSFGKYNYRSCEDIIEAVKPLLFEHKVLQVISDDIINVGSHNYVKAIVTCYDLESGDTITASALAREADHQSGMQDSQLTGSTSSYARKYALNGMYAIDDTKDADSHDNTPKPKPQKNGSNQKNSAVDKIINTLDTGIVDCNLHIQAINDAPISGELKADLIAKYKAKDDNVKEAFFKGFIQNKLRG